MNKKIPTLLALTILLAGSFTISSSVFASALDESIAVGIDGDATVDATTEVFETAEEALVNDASGVAPIRLDSQKIIRVREVKKVLGRGISDRTTGDSIQLACIGDRIEKGSLERKCDVLRFTFRNVAGEEYLIGPSFYLHDGDPIKYQMEEYFDVWSLQKDVKKQRKFAVSRILWPRLFGQKEEPNIGNDGRKALQAGLLVAQGITTKIALTAATTTASGIGLFIGAGLLSPFVFDIITLPITAIIDGANAASIWGFSGGDLKSLNSKSVTAWSIRPKKTKSKRFRSLFRGLVRVSVRDQACDGCGSIQFHKRERNFVNYGKFNLAVRGDVESSLENNPYALLSMAQEEAFKLSDPETNE